jgi:hypothetical protein
MAFVPRRQRPIGPASRPRVVLAIGQRAFVHAPSDASGMVSLTDDHGVRRDGALRDGTAVEIIGWRPRGSNGTRYRVCDRSDGSDGWLAAEELRSTESRPAPDPDAPPRPSDPYGRRFGGAY